MWRRIDALGVPTSLISMGWELNREKTTVGAQDDCHQNGVLTSGNGTTQCSKLQAPDKLARNERVHRCLRDFLPEMETSLAWHMRAGFLWQKTDNVESGRCQVFCVTNMNNPAENVRRRESPCSTPNISGTNVPGSPGFGL